MSDYTFTITNTEDRVTLDPGYIKRVLQTTTNSHTTRKNHRRWDAPEVIKACELYTSGFKPREVAEAMGRPYVTVNAKLNSVFGVRKGKFKDKNPAAKLHHENRMRSIIGEVLMTWEEVIEKA
jgi:hypothetical protein|tara:strand:- start:2911 stop:3279 length:369 start_codon:yes stop_codon:yes gene_type:complete